MRNLLLTLIVLLLTFDSAIGQNSDSATQSSGNSEINQMLQKLLDESRDGKNKKATPIPALIAGIQTHGKPIELGAVGVRKWESDAMVTTTDLVHIGSCTKAMTATLIGILVDEGKLTFETTIGEALPGLKGKIHEDYLGVTIHQLLTHTSGVPRDGFWAAHTDKPLGERRELIVTKALQRAPKHQPGSHHSYSNLGYCIAGMIAAKVENSTWEDVITKKLFKPLGMTSASFGPPGSQGKTDQPWGHLPLGKKLRPLQRDNPVPLGAAGTVHLSIEDWAKFAFLHAGIDEHQLLQPETLKKLHEVPKLHAKNAYACGWIVAKRPWGQGTVYTHSGSNTFWYATVWVAPNTKTVYFAVANAGLANNIMQTVDQAVVGLIEWQLKNK